MLQFINKKSNNNSSIAGWTSSPRGGSSGSHINRLQSPTHKPVQAPPEGTITIPLDALKELLLGRLNPVDLANELLSPEDALAITKQHTEPLVKKIKLDTVKISTVQDVLYVGLCYAGFDAKRQSCRERISIERFQSFYKACPEAVLDLKTYMDTELDLDEGEQVDFMHLLWALNFLKLYESEHVFSGRWQFHEDTLRKHTWNTLAHLSAMSEHLITFDDDEFGDGVHELSVDCVNFTVNELRTDPSSKWFDQKSHSAGFKYEFALGIFLKRQSCVWSRGPFPAGAMNDGVLFRGGRLDEPRESWDPAALYSRIPEGKKAIGDSGYVGTPEKCTIAMDEHSDWVKHIINRVKARQENYHKLMKDFGVLYQRFRHGKTPEDRMAKHKICVDSVHVILHFDLNHRPLLDV